jgi:hypothetical protein
MVSITVEELSRQSNWRRAAKTMASYGNKAVWEEKRLSAEKQILYKMLRQQDLQAKEKMKLFMT